MSAPESTDFGGMLRAARERQGLTLKQLAETTKISPSVLASLEANDVDQLPGGLFIRAFVRSYAAEVGLDPEHTVDALLEAYPDQRLSAVVRPRVEPAGSVGGQQQPSLVRTAIGLLIISVIVVGLLLFFGVRGSTGADTDDETAAVDDVVVDGTAPSGRRRAATASGRRPARHAHGRPDHGTGGGGATHSGRSSDRPMLGITHD